MKNTYLFLCLLLSFPLIAQNTEGIIYYTSTVQMEIDLPEGQEYLKDLLPSSHTSNNALFFTAKESLYKNIEANSLEGKEIDSERREGNVMIKLVSTDDVDNRLYKNFETESLVISQDFMGKKFLIEENIPHYTWKITGEQKNILGYACQKAILQDSSTNVSAWFTPQILFPNGPERFGQLPGMILELNVDDGREVTIASEIKLEKLTPDAITIPKKGKKVTQQEYESIRDKKMEELEEQMGGNRLIKIERH